MHHMRVLVALGDGQSSRVGGAENGGADLTDATAVLEREGSTADDEALHEAVFLVNIAHVSAKIELFSGFYITLVNLVCAHQNVLDPKGGASAKAGLAAAKVKADSALKKVFHAALGRRKLEHDSGLTLPIFERLEQIFSGFLGVYLPPGLLTCNPVSPHVRKVRTARLPCAQSGKQLLEFGVQGAGNLAIFAAALERVFRQRITSRQGQGLELSTLDSLLGRDQFEFQNLGFRGLFGRIFGFVRFARVRFFILGARGRSLSHRKNGSR